MKLSALLGLWEAAAELALDVDIQLAKTVADMPDDENLQRRLWLGVGEISWEILLKYLINKLYMSLRM